jgi:tetratricopeptide (TPR) repeat protein
MYFWASLAEHRADRAEAVARWRKVARAFPRSVDAVFGFGRACKAAGQMADAEAAFRRGTQIAPENPVPRLEYARMAEGREDWEGALQRYEAMQAAVRHVGGWTGAAACLRKLGRDDEAIELLEQACLKFDTRWEPLIALGRIARDHGDLERAAAHFQKAARNFPQSEEAALGAAEVLRELGRMDEADAILGSYANRREAGWGGVLAYARSAHGRDWPEAARRWALVRAKFPNRPEGYALGADALERAGEKEEADRIRASKPASG